MKQPPIVEFRDDREARLYHGRSGWRAYLVALPVVAAIAGVAFLGVTGPKGTPSDTARPSARSTPTPLWTAAPTPGPIDVPGLSTIQVSDSETVTAALPPDTLPLDADGGNFLYATAGRLYVLAWGQTPQTPIQVATARPCAQIDKASLSGTDVIYSQIVPAGDAPGGRGTCPSLADAVNWYVSITNFSGVGRLVASGTSAGQPPDGVAASTPDVAIADAMYAFSRTDSSGTSTVVEVHRLIDDSLQYKSVALALPVQVRLGDGRLVVVSPGPAPVDGLAGTTSVLSTDDWTQPLVPFGLTAGPAALSRDGRRLAFSSCEPDGDKLKCDLLETFAPGIHWGIQLPIAATFVCAGSGPESDLAAVAWTSYAAGGSPYIGVDSALGDKGVALVGMDQPMWISLQGDALLWLSLAPDGSAALHRLDLLSVISAT